MKTNSALEKAMALAAKLSGSEPVQVQSIPDPVEYEKEEENKRENKMIAFEGVTLQAHHKHALMMKKCRRCGHVFQTSYCYVALCSDECRRAEFKESYGIEWDALKRPQSFWEMEKPLVVPPEIVENLAEWARYFLAQYDQAEASQPPGRLAPIPPEVREEAQSLQTEYKRTAAQETLRNLDVTSFGSDSSTPETPSSPSHEEGYEPQANLPGKPDNQESPAFDFSAF